MVRALHILGGLCGFASATPHQRLDDASALIQQVALSTRDEPIPAFPTIDPELAQMLKDPAVKQLFEPVKAGWKNMVRTVHELNHNEKEGSPNRTWAITANSIKRSLPSGMQKLVDDVGVTAIQEQWGQGEKNAHEIMASVLKTAWKKAKDGAHDGSKQLQRNLFAVGMKDKSDKVFTKLNLARQAVDGKMQALSQVAMPALQNVMQAMQPAAPGAQQQVPWAMAQPGMQQQQQQQQQQQMPWGPMQQQMQQAPMMQPMQMGPPAYAPQAQQMQAQPQQPF